MAERDGLSLPPGALSGAARAQAWDDAAISLKYSVEAHLDLLDVRNDIASPAHSASGDDVRPGT